MICLTIVAPEMKSSRSGAADPVALQSYGSARRLTYGNIRANVPESANGREQRGDIRHALDPNCFVWVELPADLLFDGKHQAQVCEAIPAFKTPNPRVVWNHRRVAISRLGQ
jgi:hypothetical protein